MEAVEKRIDYVSPEEIALAIAVAVDNSCGMPETDAPAETARLLGFGRTGHDIKSAIATVVERLVDDGTLDRGGGYLIAKRANPT
jgi:hypothetical protein